MLSGHAARVWDLSITLPEGTYLHAALALDRPIT